MGIHFGATQATAIVYLYPFGIVFAAVIVSHNPTPVAKVVTKKGRKLSSKKGKKEERDFVVFIDTNVLLDLYRSRGDATLKRVTALVDQKDKLITTSQVYDEFRRNRLNALTDGLQGLQTKSEKALIPGAFQDLQATASYEKAFVEYQKRQKALVEKLHKMIEDPRQDPVAQLVKKLFASPGPNHLDAVTSELSSAILEKAKLRAAVGNPPRKKNDPSIGDAINWEWCLYRCATMSKDLVIVSRDTDYGQEIRKQVVLNSLLADDFKLRVSQKRKVVLTREVSQALDLIGVKLTRKQKEAERKEVADIDRASRTSTAHFEPSLESQLRIQLDAIMKALDTTRKRDDATSSSSPT